MKALIEWIRNLLGLKKFEEPEVVVEETVVEEKLTPPQPPKAKPKVSKPTKATLSKLTKKQLEEKANELGLTVSTKLKKDEMVKEVLKQLK